MAPGTRAAGAWPLRHRRLLVVHAYLSPYILVPLSPAPLGEADIGVSPNAERIVREAVQRVRRTAPNDVGTTVARCGC